ncbi:hypothetical protein ABMA28_008070 [Loxostege sticticalis]|uniref:BRCT domain-containing protein n=2 Tax=Loxostege sticticalis TaxID=481309 RepID=A0ABD0SFW6_LOXSC
MNKENNRSAAGLRRSAIAERIRLREEWSELKGAPDPLKSSNRVLTKKPQTAKRTNTNHKPVAGSNSNIKRNLARDVLTANIAKSVRMSSEVLLGVVALVDVGAESRALALRAALMALGASVVPAWSPIVTHLVWAQGGCRATRAKARALASRLVSPLWVEACAASNKRLPEQSFPAAARASDLPSPRTLRQLLKKAENENIPLFDLLSDKEDENPKAPRLRLSSETELDTSEDKTTDTSRDTSHDTSRDKSGDTSREKTAIESRVNTAPRRALPISISPAPPAKSRRKLFTQKEAEDTKTKASDDDSDADTTKLPKAPPKPTQRERKGLARAERLARKLVAAATPLTRTQPPSASIDKPRIVLTGMGRTERQAVSAAIRSFDGRIQAHVTRKTTHVLLGSFREDTAENHCSGIASSHLKTRNVNNNCAVTVMKSISENNRTSNVNCDSNIKNNCDISGVANLDNLRLSGVTNEPLVVHRSEVQKARTLNALAGAARGCRVLCAQWALDSKAAGKWIHHHGYEVPHLRKISLKARIERSALGRMRSEYAYDVFSGMKVLVSPDTDQKDAATQLLKLCGAVVVDGSTGQHGGQNGAQFDMTLGNGDGEVNSKWVFDSVAAARMRSTRRYVNNRLSCTGVTSQSNR